VKHLDGKHVMPFGQKPASQIKEADLLALIETKTNEGKEIEYKRELPGNADRERREYLYDVSSFANTLGGYLIFGMEESGGIPIEPTGMQGINPDDEIRRLEEMARHGIRPPITGIQTAPVNLAAGPLVIVMRIPKSWNPPHQVTYQKAFRFYARDTNGKYQLDVNELRAVFTRSQEIGEKMRQFRINRIAKIVAGDVATFLASNARMVIHLLPFSAFASLVNLELRELPTASTSFVELIGGFSNYRFNIDGFAAWNETGYVQVFRNGCLEIVSTCARSDRPQSAAGLLPSVGFERQIFGRVRHSKALLQSLSVECPIAIMVSFTGIKGWRMGVPPEKYATSAIDVFDREPLLIPEILIETFQDSEVSEMRPIVDAIWNAAGWPGSPHYNERGEWDESR
jgi:Schlafen, AlbA_2